jgi:formylglycine-generating enzyme required for sulfatase activity
MRKPCLVVPIFLFVAFMALYTFSPYVAFTEEPETRVALVIGNGKYQFNKTLKNPVNDATDMASVLKSSGFAVTLLTDVGRAAMEKAVRDFGISLKNPDAVGLFYYSGHGAQTEGQNYLLPVDADIQDVDEMRYKALDAESVLAKMRSAGNKLNIVVLDACRNNPFPGSARSSEKGLSIVKVKVPESVIVYATDPGSIAADGSGRNSPFTAAFMVSMKEPGLDITMMMKRVTSRVLAETDGAQTPWVSMNLTRDFVFKPAKSQNDTPVTEPVASALPKAPRLSSVKTHGSVSVESKLAGTLFLDNVEQGAMSAGISRLDDVETGEHVLEMHYTDEQSEKVTVMVIKDAVISASFVHMLKPMALEIELVLVKSGCFQMGDNFTDGYAEEKPVHEICVDGFYIGRYEVSQGQWKAIMSENPSYNKNCGDNCPVENVSWNDIQGFIRRLNQQTGLTFRLPTEAEWEYAARSGGKNEKWAGSSNASELGEYAWYKDNSNEQTHPVGQKKPNNLGIYDMSGNVWEWVSDWYDEKYYQKSPHDNPQGSPNGKRRVVRGGSWFYNDWFNRCTLRARYSPGDRYDLVGFRVARSAQ